jgi:ribosomal protein S18 acetylase RimI-like enzyme
MLLRAIQPENPSDVAFLGQMLVEAVNWSPDRPRLALKDVLAEPHHNRYVHGWGRRGDGGVIAEESGERIGACWYRLFPADDPGYGFVDDRTPELGIAVVAEHRRRGVGRALLGAALSDAASEGFAAISLSVEPDNPSRLLYAQFGFVQVGMVEGSWTMRAELLQQPKIRASP